MGERVTGIDGQRRQHGPDLAREVARQRGPLVGRELRGAQDPHARLLQARADLLAPDAVLLGHHGVRARADGRQLLGRGHAVGGRLGDVAGQLLLEPATRIMKNSSRFEATIDRNFRRSSRGTEGSRASSRTRLLNSSQDSSRLTKSRAFAGRQRRAL